MVSASLVFKFEFYDQFCYYGSFPNRFYNGWIKSKKFIYYDTHVSPKCPFWAGDVLIIKMLNEFKCLLTFM